MVGGTYRSVATDLSPSYRSVVQTSVLIISTVGKLLDPPPGIPIDLVGIPIDSK